MNWYKIFQRQELTTVQWELFRQQVRWNLAATEFILEYVDEPADKTSVMNRDEAAAYTKNAEWETGEPLGLNSGGEG